MHSINISRGTIVASSVTVARSIWARSRGLLGRKGLANGEGLLLLPCSGIHTFGMAFPIDAIFLDERGVVIHLVEEMKPLRVSRYVIRARSVLELPAGAIRQTGTQIGDRLIFED